MENIRSVLADLPYSIKAYTVCQDGFYTIILNENLNYEQRHKSYMHELEHIYNSDFEKLCSVDLIEFYSH